jgi:DNA replication initiation complex subunit (GINS family)
MSEENPVFKVTDRRLFNADGTPREIEQEAETKTDAVETKESAPADESRVDASTQGAPAATRSAAQAPTQTEPSGDSTSVANKATATSEVRAESSAQAEQFPEDEYAESEIPGADDPASFINFLMSIASNAAAALGMMEHPVTGQRTTDPELGKHWIDVLGMLQQKTQGNLAPQEKQIFEGLLADLRMQYVSLTSTRPAPKSPRGFSGSDITGGR